MKIAHHQWPLAKPWLWHCQQCWGPGNYSIPCLSVQHQWWSGHQSGIQKIGWMVEEVGRKTASSVRDENRSHTVRLQQINLANKMHANLYWDTSYNVSKIVLDKVYFSWVYLPDCLLVARKWLAVGYQWPRTGRWLFCQPQPPGSLVSPQKQGALEDSHDNG